MIRISLEPARNGVIKRVTDDNYGGAKQAVSTVDVYESKGDKDKFEHVMKFFYDLCEDLSLDLGNKFERETLSFNKAWGSHYEPNKKEVEMRIKELETELEILREWKQDQ